jgi:mitochondrial fission protein ELM1
MKILCKNALFCLKFNIIITDDIIIGTATATAVCLKALPLPMPLNIFKNPSLKSEKDQLFIENLQ